MGKNTKERNSVENNENRCKYRELLFAGILYCRWTLTTQAVNDAQIIDGKKKYSTNGRKIPSLNSPTIRPGKGKKRRDWSGQRCSSQINGSIYWAATITVSAHNLDDSQSLKQIWQFHRDRYQVAVYSFVWHFVASDLGAALCFTQVSVAD